MSKVVVPLVVVPLVAAIVKAGYVNVRERLYVISSFCIRPYY